MPSAPVMPLAKAETSGPFGALVDAFQPAPTKLKCAGLETRSPRIKPAAALKAWLACAPRRPYALPRCRLPELVMRVTGSGAVEGGQQLKGFVTSGEEVHFLYFWQALHQMRETEVAASIAEVEVEALRDETLRLLEVNVDGATPRTAGGPVLLPGVIIEQMHRMAATSQTPRFWQCAMAQLDSSCLERPLGIRELTNVMLSLAKEAADWDTSSLLPVKAALHGPSGGSPVLLHIYDVTKFESIQMLNWIFAHENSPLKFGGAFHAGVEVGGLEWGFEYQPHLTKPGVSCTLPRRHWQHHFRETVVLEPTYLSSDKIADIITTMIEEYPGDDYHFLHRNCCNFADDFVTRLGNNGIPPWVHRFAQIGSQVDGAIHAAKRWMSA